MSSSTGPPVSNAIAIIGMAGRFPGARDLREFWVNLREGRESIRFFTGRELAAAGVDESLLDDPHYVRAKAVLEDADMFDARFFGYTPREAELMDPQHRLLLECAWQALEDAGYDAQRSDASIGMYAGANLDTYLLNHYERSQFESPSSLALRLASDVGMLATRVSYKLGLKGPAITVQTACSTSLVAVCQAAQALMTYQCDMALAGAATVKAPRIEGYRYEENGILSPDGHCRPFDAGSGGTVPGEGACVIVLKRLREAVEDGDTIRAVIRGWSLNNDGDEKVGFTAPSVNGQADVIAMAHALADVNSDTISYVEAHGTGTELGDPIEIAALTQAFAETTDKKGFCAIGSVKSNIGHLDAAAGIAGLVKTVLALEQKELPPHLHFRTPNPRIDFAASPFFVNTQLAPWPAAAMPRRAGVSSFGMGGTNAHVVLEEAPAPRTSGTAAPQQLLLLSARTPMQLEAAARNLAQWLRDRPGANLADVAYTLQAGRRRFAHAAALVCRDVEDAVRALDEYSPERILSGERTVSNESVTFMFPGQGNQYVEMGLGLYRTEPVFRRHVDECCDVLHAELGQDLRSLMYPAQGDTVAARERLKQTAVAQPALFVIEYALARLLKEWGIQPRALIGHSIGEYVAAALAGVFTLEDALKLVAARGRLMQMMPEGAMLAVALPADTLSPRLVDGVSLAAVNESFMSVVSGAVPAIERLESLLATDGVTFHRLHTSHAFHSEMMEPILAPFADIVGGIRLSEPHTPFVSNLTGTWITGAQATDPDYWVRHLRHTVRFADGVHELLQQPGCVLLEVGPGTSLAAVAGRHPDRQESQPCIPTMHHARDRRDDRACLLEAVGRLCLAGVEPDWRAVHGSCSPRRIGLPTYPFERERYWLEGPGRAGGRSAVSPAQPSSSGDWFYVPSWRRHPVPAVLSGAPLLEAGRRWVIFADACGVGEALGERLEALGQTVVTVRPGAGFGRRGAGAYTVSVASPQDHAALFEALEESGAWPTDLVYLWPVGAEEALEEYCFYGPLHIAQALGERGGAAVRMHVVSEGAQSVTGEETLVPEQALVWGPCTSIGQEYGHIECASVDITPGARSEARREELIEQLLGEFAGGISAEAVAYRGGYRWTRAFESVSLAGSETPPVRLRRGGVYLLTGGLGGMGLALAGYLTGTLGAKVVLVGRTALPARAEWDEWLSDSAEDDGVGRRIRAVRALEAGGGEVEVVSADVSELEQMRAAVARGRERFGAIHGVIHAAGVPAGGLIQLKTRAEAARVLAPKVAGVRVLDAVLRGEELDFMVLCSSLVTASGSAGQVDYTAANAYLDAYAQWRTARGDYTVAVDWDAWREAGMAVETQVPGELSAQREANLAQGLSTAEGVEALLRILGARLPQVLVSRRAVLSRGWSPSSVEEAEQAPVRPRHERPTALAETYVAPAGETEETIAGIWQDLFNIEAVGSRDDFFELGGHSLLALQAVSRIREHFEVSLTIEEFLELGNIGNIAARVEARRWVADGGKGSPPGQEERYEFDI